VAIRFILGGDRKDRLREVRNKDELVRCIDGPDYVGPTAVQSSDEEATHITELRLGTTKVRRSHNRGTQTAMAICGKDEVLLLFAHAAFVRMRGAWVGLIYEVALG
jgi:hypothetical protein